MPDVDRVPLHLGEHAGGYGLSLSGLVVRDDTMFLAPDEGAALVRLVRDGEGWGSPVEFPLADHVDLPGRPGDEVDVEGLDVADGCLWVVGSHSAKRKRVKDGTPPGEVAARLARVEAEKSRRVVARIPLVEAPGGAAPAPRGTAVDGVAAARLPAGRRGLVGALADDEHLAPFLAVPGKDNGFDVEGIAVVGPRVLLGLRGPVLRGWATILSFAPSDSTDPPGELALGAVTKHFLDLGGLGVRDLARDGDDLLLLVGPTMVLDGPARVLRLAVGARAPLPPAVPRAELEVVAELAVGEGGDRPEGLAVVPGGLLVLHDSPAPERLAGETVLADLLRA